MNLVNFPKKEVKKEEVKKVTTLYTGFKGEPSLNKGVTFLRDFNFREAFNTYPDNPVIPFKLKQDILTTKIRVSELASAAVFAKDILGDHEASDELVQLFLLYLNSGIVALSIGMLPEHLIGFVIWLGEDMGTTRRSGQHVASPIMLKYGFTRSAKDFSLKPKK